jgi:prepilin-type N-terminal cleavage/methylation domain-containing protein
MTYHKSHQQKKTKGFTLVELLVAMAILAMMMTSMFSMLSGSMAAWQTGNKRIEAAQTARVGLNIIANDLRRAISDQQISYTTSGTAITNTVPFFATNNASTTMDLGGDAVNAVGSSQVFGVLATGKTNQPFEEFGYLCAYLGTDDGTNMTGNKYYLVRKSSTGTKANFYLQGNATTDFAGDSDVLVPIIENCVRMEFSYFSANCTDSSTNYSFSDRWTNNLFESPSAAVRAGNASITSYERLNGILVSVWVLDSSTADKIAALSSEALSSTQIDSITNAVPSTDAVGRLLQRGAVRMQRFIPLNKN